MKRIRPVKLKTTVIGRNGKRYHYVPVNVSVKRSNIAPKSLQNPSMVISSLDNAGDSCAEENNSGGLSNAQRRRVSSMSNWEKVRQKILEAFVEDSCLQPHTSCVFDCGSEATVRCNNCGPGQFMCLACAKQYHSLRHQFHLLELWKDGMFVPVYPDHGVVGYGHHCSTKITRLFTLIDNTGIKHRKRVEVCSCEPDAVTLIRCNFWPGSPHKPTVGIHSDFMNLIEKLFLQSQVSLYDFAEVINSMQPKLGMKTLSSIYSVLNSGCFEEFRYFKYQLHYMDKLCPKLATGIHCPLCPEDEGVLIESMDACMGLVRKKSKGAGIIQPRQGNLIFSDQNDVDNFVDNYGKDGAKLEKNCNRFHAGEVLSSLRSKGKNKLFDEKGVFGRVCRHDFPRSFINLKYGERISYSVYEIMKIRKSVADTPNVRVILMYDIACILSSHLKCTSQEQLIQNMDLAIPIFHCYGHKASCQIEYSPRRIEGIGLTDGEGVERLWSYLRGFSYMTKEMGPEKRTDVLTDALIYYGQRLRCKFGTSLKDKLQRAHELAGKITAEIQKITAALPYPCSPALMKTWKESELKAIKPRENVLELQWDEKYADLIMEIQKIRSDFIYVDADAEHQTVHAIQKKKKRKEKELTTIERKHGIRTTWKTGDAAFENARTRLISKKKNALMLDLQRLSSERLFLLEMKKKYADGQSIAIKLSSQITKVTDSMKKSLCSLNALDGTEDNFQFEDIKDPGSDFFLDGNVPTLNDSHSIPQSTIKNLIGLSFLHERCLEEIDLVRTEMIRLITFLFNQIQIIETFLGSLQSSSFDQGLKALLHAKKAGFQDEHAKLEKLWEGLSVSPYIPQENEWFQCMSDSYDTLQLENDQPEQNSDYSSEDESFNCDYSESDTDDDI